MMVFGLVVALMFGALVYAYREKILDLRVSPSLFSDDFSGNLSKWSVVNGQWMIEGGELSGSVDVDRAVIVAGDSGWTNYEGSCRAMIISGKFEAQIVLRYKDPQNYYFAGLGIWGYIGIGKFTNGVASLIASSGTGNYQGINSNVWYSLKVRANGSLIELYVNDELKTSVHDLDHSSGMIGLRVYQSHVHFDDIVVKSLPSLPSSSFVLPLTGIGEDYLLVSWLDLIPKLKYWKFNTFRLAFTFPDSPATGWHHSRLDYTKLNNVLNILYSNGIKAILDLHNYKDMYGWFGSDAWINDWVSVAKAYKGDKRIVAFEVFNEPYRATWSPNVQSNEDVVKAFARCTDAIRAVDLERTVIWAGPWYYGNYIPPELVRSNVVYSFHVWSYTSDTTESMAYADSAINEMITWEKSYGPVWLGEFGIYPAYDLNVQKAFTVRLINGCVDNHIGFSWWLYSNEPNVDAVLSESKYAQLIR